MSKEKSLALAGDDPGKKKFPLNVAKNAIYYDTDADEIHKWNGKKWIQIYPKKKQNS